MPESPKRVLLFSAKLGYQTRSLAAAAKKLNVELAYVTDRCHQLSDPWEDHAIAAHFEKPAEAAQTAVDHWRGKDIHGILALGDRPAHAASFAARALSIPFHHPAAVEACRNKKRTREVLRDAALPGPWFRAIALEPAPEPALLGISYPCVLKPLALSASQGVVRANNREDFVAAAARIRKLLRTPEIQATREANLDEMIVEGYLPGREVAVEALMTAGELRVLAIFDKPDALEGPYFEETIYVTPSRLSESQIAATEKMLRACVAALGLSHGPVHAEFRIDEAAGQIWPLEIAPRPIGGLCAESLRFVAPGQVNRAESFGLEELLLRHALELPGREAARESAASGVMMIPVPSSGIFHGVSGEAGAATTGGVSNIVITARVHDYIAAWPEGASYLGFIFATGETPEIAEAALRAAHGKLNFAITPRLAVHHPSALL
jgi:biotin carboxylase